ncbi:FAD binding domain-containing protein [Acuticoccus mangrovi]|uniref:FAD binding domain-containing protein n=1 Tax=Acuticoccus mangrovi TaxID=2796142 RepID=A0A934IT55_9HYPH|nr:FAD binding domain-containing protein [Acuticoccus mangrovi]MBJ3778265.1 FAD binding domain-containing protein [Acuticoccus mangrovi]
MPTPQPHPALPARPVALPTLVGHRGRHAMPPFTVHTAASFAEARRLMTLRRARPLAGGLDLLNGLKTGAGPADIVMLERVAGAATIAIADGDLLLGPMVTHDGFATSPAARARVPALAAVWSEIANLRIRAQGTIAGNLLAGMPAYEAAVLLAAVDASLDSLAPDGTSARFPVAALGTPTGAARPFDHLVTAIRVPCTPLRLAYDRSLRPALSVAVALTTRLRRTVSIVVGGLHPRPIVRRAHVSDLDAPGDLAARLLADLPLATVPFAGSPFYRERMAAVLAARLLAELAR